MLKIIGLSVRTSNQNSQATQDLAVLWQQFRDVLTKIPNKVNHDILMIYTDYEGDYTAPYTALLGVEVSDLSDVPEGMVAREFPHQKFQTFLVKGALPKAVLETWQTIWQQDPQLHRTYTYDYERYGQKSQQNEPSEVEINIAIETK